MTHDNEGKTLLQLCNDKEWDYIKENVTAKITEWDIDEFDEKGNTPLHKICDEGLLEVIKKIHEKKFVYVKERNFEGETLLLSACSSGNVELIKWCLANGSSLDEQDFKNYTCTMYAAVSKDKNAVEYLAEQGCSLTASGNNGESCISFAAQSGCIETLKFLIEKGCSVKTLDSKGSTPFLLACGAGKLENVKFLLENGSSLDETSEGGESAIANALLGGNLPLVKFLIEQGVSLQTPKNGGFSLLHLAVTSRKLDVVKFLVVEKGMDMNDNSAGLAAAFYALCCGNAEIIRWMFENGADANGEQEGLSYLQYSVMQCSLECVKILMMNGADRKIKTEDGKNLTHLACTAGKYPCVEWLIRNDVCSFTENNSEGENCFFAAISSDSKSDSVKMLKFLFQRLTHKKSSKEATKLIKTYLKMKCSEDIDLVGTAAIFENLEALKYLVKEHGASLTARYPNGKTLLHLAVYKGCLPIVKWLVEEMDCDIEECDNDFTNAVLWASSNGHLKIIKYLVKNGASLQSVNVGGTCIMNAASNMHLKCVLWMENNGSNLSESSCRSRSGDLYCPLTCRKLLKRNGLLDLYLRLKAGEVWESDNEDSEEECAESEESECSDDNY